MSQPPDKYERIFDFTDFSATQPSAQQPGQKIDQELNAARESLNETIDRLGEIQRDDGKLRSSALDTTEFNGIVNAATATATAAASSASASASTATTKASEATSAATTASGAATTATGAAASAQAQASIASTAATTATTKATEAINSAASALASNNSAYASAATATSKAAEASGHAVYAATSAGNAANSANQAGAQANLAVAAAVEAENAANSFGLSVGTVTTGASGSPATVSVSGSAPAYVLNFGIPTGPAGADGSNGVGLPAGGTTGQVAKKASNTDYDVIWEDEAGGAPSPADSMTSDHVSAVTQASYKDWTANATAEMYYASGVIAFTDTTAGSDGRTINFIDGSGFAINNAGSSWNITVPTSVGGSGTTYYVEDLISELQTSGSGLTATWSGSTGSDALDSLPGQAAPVLLKPSLYITTGSKLMLQSGLGSYLVADGIANSATTSSVPYFNGTFISWGKPWQSEGYVTGAALTGYALLSGATFTGKVNTAATAAGGAGLNIPHGTAPSVPVNGDVWSTTTGLFMRQNGSTQQYVDFAGTQTITGSKTFSNANLSFGTATTAGTINVASGATASASTKTVNVGTGGVAGSTTNITIGSNSGGTSTNTFNGTSTFAGKVNTVASATTGAGLNIPSGSAPTSPTTGDVWFSGTTLAFRASGGNRSVPTLEAANSYSAGIKQSVSHSAASAGLRIAPVASSVTTPAVGDVWHDSSSAGQIVGWVGSTPCAMSACRAFVNFNGTGTVATRSTFNVTSITDNGVGDYTVNFTTALFDTNYSPQITTSGFSTTNVAMAAVVHGAAATGATTKTTGALRIQTGSSNTGAVTDMAEINVAIFR